MSERRREPRVRSIDYVSVAKFDAEGFQGGVTLGQTSDLSHDGVRLELTHPLPLRSTVALSLGVSGEVIEVKAVVVSVNEIDGVLCSLGLQFTEVSHEAKAVIHRFLERVRRVEEEGDSDVGVA